jgi:hypothetical protein
VLGLAALSVPGLAAVLEIPDAGSLVAQATDSSEGLVGSAASTLSALLSLAFAMLGVVHLRRSRLVAYRWLERSVLVSLLLGQVLLFWQDQLTRVWTKEAQVARGTTGAGAAGAKLAGCSNPRL